MEQSRKLKQLTSRWKTRLLKSQIEIVYDKGIDNVYHILYITIQLSTGKIYVGIHSSSNLNDNYIGCGIKSNIYNENSIYTKRSLKRSHLWKAVLKYGIKDFERRNVFLFDSRKSLLEAEKLIVTKRFIRQSLNFNCMIGGSCPPVKRGDQNGNFGKRWTEKKKKDLSEYFKKHRNTTRGANSKALRCVAVDIFSRQIQRYECGRDMADGVGLTYLTINTWLRNSTTLSGNVRKKRFVCFLEKDYEDKKVKGELDKYIQKIIDRSNLINKLNYVNN